MLFKNIKTGNIVSPSDETTIELMQKSPIYEQVESSAEAETVVEAEPKEETKKPTAKTANKNK